MAPDDRHAYEWFTLRLVPDVARGECLNVGVVLFVAATDHLAWHLALDEARAVALHPGVDLAAVRTQLTGIEELLGGHAVPEANASRRARERFRWLAAPRSTILQPSAVHAGITDDPAAELARLTARMVAPPGGPDAQ